MATATAASFGAVPLDGGLAGMRVWAPHARSVAVRLDSGEHPLAEEGDGFWASAVPATVR